MALTIRSRLTLWYSTVLLVVLVLFGAWVYAAELHLRVEHLDRELRRAGTVAAAAVADELDEGASLPDAAPEAYKDLVVPGRMLAIHDAAGIPLAGGWEDGLPAIKNDTLGASDETSATITRADQDWRLSIERRRHREFAYYVVVAEPLAPIYGERAILRRTLLIGIPLALGLAALGGWWIARRALDPVRLMVGQARRITDRTPGFRISVPHPEDELGVLAGAFNELLERLEGALHAQRRFMADASHELRTPVSIVRTAAEVTLGRETRTEQEYRESLGIVAQQARRLARMVDDLMTLERADAGGLTVELADFYLDELVRESVHAAAVLATERRVEVRSPSAPETAFRGDERLLRQMLMNLLDNGIRHTAPGGQVEARVTSLDGSVEIAVADTGCGVPPDERARIFERFIRLDPARSRPGGAGLGLPIARCIAESHGGTLTLAESGPSGSTFVVRLPRVHALS